MIFSNLLTGYATPGSQILFWIRFREADKLFNSADNCARPVSIKMNSITLLYNILKRWFLVLITLFDVLL